MVQSEVLSYNTISVSPSNRRQSRRLLLPSIALALLIAVACLAFFSENSAQQPVELEDDRETQKELKELKKEVEELKVLFSEDDNGFSCETLFLHPAQRYP